MTPARVLVLLLFAGFIFSCGGSAPPPKKIDGVWFAELDDSTGILAYTFSATLTQGAGSSVNVSSFGFTNSAPCFSSPTGQTATFSVTGSSGGYQTGPFAMNISTAMGVLVENVLTLDGSRKDDGTISGTWTLTGLLGCSANGTYTMRAPVPL